MSKFLTIINGVRRLASAITSSAGSADASKIVATKSDGKLDNSFIDWASPGAIGSSVANTLRGITLQLTGNNQATSTTTGDLTARGAGFTGNVFVGGSLNNMTFDVPATNAMRAGSQAGNAMTSSSTSCTAIGRTAGFNATGTEWTALGAAAGQGNSTGSRWTAIGASAGQGITGSNWVAVGWNAGNNSATSGSVFLGYMAGKAETNNNRLHIANTDVESLILGDFSSKWVQINGRLIINAATGSAFRLGELPGFSDYAGMWIGSAATNPLNNNYVFLSQNTGTEVLFNAPTGGVVKFRNNNNDILTASGSQVAVTSSATFRVNNSTNSTAPTNGSAVVFGGLGVALDIFGGGSLTLPGLVISSIGAVQTRGVGAGTTAGNARGTASIDLQTSRSAAAQVASGSASVIGGGRNNTASGLNAVSAGGNGNTASGQESCAGGGETNTASATYSFVPGGSRGVANKYGQQAHASGRFSADGDAQRSSLVARISTTDATPTGLTLDGVSSTLVTLANNQAWRFTIEVIAKQMSSSNHAAFRFEGTITKGTTNASTAIGSSGVTKVSTLNGMTWDCNVSADTTNGALLVTATGAAATSIRWVGSISLVEVIA
jgi:hypothetical protein